MHKWLAMTLFPRGDYRPIRDDEMRILYAMVKKIKITPVQCMIKQWLEHLKMTGPIECTSLITRLAFRLGEQLVEYVRLSRPAPIPAFAGLRLGRLSILPQVGREAGIPHEEPADFGV